MKMTKDELIQKIYKDLDSRFKVSDREFSLIRTAVLDAYIHFELRKCSNCKYSTVAEDTYSGDIVSMFCEHLVGEFEVCDVAQNTPDFGCNKWSMKDD